MSFLMDMMNWIGLVWIWDDEDEDEDEDGGDDDSLANGASWASQSLNPES